MAGNGNGAIAGRTHTWRNAGRYVRRALALDCPVCGTKPIFKTWRRVRSFYDWFTPLDGCPRCGYPYEREPGYFLLAVFGFNFGIGTTLGIGSFICLAAWGDAANTPMWVLLLTTALPIPLINLLIARHMKALFIALDHFVDPFVHETQGDAGWEDDDGNDDGGSPGVRPGPASGGEGGQTAPREEAFAPREPALAGRY